MGPLVQKLLAILRQCPQIIKSSVGPMLRKGPVGLHKLHAHKAGPVMKVTRITAIYMKCVPFVVNYSAA